MLGVSHLRVAYGRSQVLHDVSLEVPDGSLVCVMGRNGVGKTTLLNSLMGVLPPNGGTVHFNGVDLTQARSEQRVQAGMGYVPQGHEAFAQLTVWENLLVVQEASSRGTRAQIDEALDLFPRLRPLLKRRAGFLSGGQQQQLAIARALVTRPTLLLLDEPTEGIQPSIILEIEAAIAGLHQQGELSILLVEQYLAFALRLADSYLVLEAGEVVRSGPASELADEEVRRLLSV
ncbi:MAG: urea transport system ATP-binding protein [Acidimicrobiaceae bacterium]|nr:urea transport system ATP-binding protein [Acidimicrobiaceae bacterium]